MSNAAPAVVDPGTAVVQIIQRYKPVIRKLLARTTISEETFIAQLGNAFRGAPKLWGCEPETVLGAALRCAQLALPPNDGNNLTWIIPYKTTATFQLGYGGVIELARRAVPGLRFDGHPVYPGDLFALDFGKTPPLKHTPHWARRPAKPRGGAAIAWYVRATYPDGAEQVHALDVEGVEYHRGFSKQPDGDMWSKSYDAAALKSVVLDMRRWLPNSPPLALAIASDGETLHVAQMAEEVSHTPGREQANGELDAASSEGPEPETHDEDAAWVEAAKGGPS